MHQLGGNVEKKSKGVFEVRKIFFTCVLSLLSYTVIGQPNVSVVWDYFDADKVLYNVSSFKICFDNNTAMCVTAPATGGIVMSDTTPGAVSYQTPLPSMNNGNHTLSVQACETTANCSDQTNLTFVVNKKPNAPVKVRVK